MGRVDMLTLRSLVPICSMSLAALASVIQALTYDVCCMQLIARVSTVAARFWGIGVGFWLGALPAAPLSLLAFRVVGGARFGILFSA